ncbi:MAG: hypothetical protein HYV14_05945 [Elusimicrobia bacterium]|nr:hypothetical protein [Elusimicrobiota bacterium]
MRPRLIPLALVLLAAGCAAWRIWGEIPVPAGPAAPSGAADVPEAPADRRRAALFYSDLGPDSVDVSSYPPERRRDYEAYARLCSRCHTLARSINAPYAERAWWEFYLASMRMRAHFHGEPLSKDDTRAVLDFLEYDSRERKLAQAPRFEALKKELERRFETALDERMERLQKNALPHRPR